MDGKLRILDLLHVLQEQTDEGKALTNSELRQYFQDKGEYVSLPTLRDDIASLRQAGYDIDVNEVNGVATYYKYLDREWTLPELQILIDAVSSGQFLTADKTQKIIEKLKRMAGPTEREQLSPGILVPDRLKAPNEQILYIVQTIKDAIRKDRQISFQHYEYDVNLERVPKHDGYVYFVSPYALVWKKDRYYLVGWSEKHKKVTHFRIDRMGMPKITRRKRKAAPEDLKLEDRTDKIFSMFDGPEETVTLRCTPGILSQVIDQFGDEVKITKRKGMLEIRTAVHLSPTFYGWLFQYVGEMTVLRPKKVREAYAGYLQKALEEVQEGK